jgi:hypothetical protein
MYRYICALHVQLSSAPLVRLVVYPTLLNPVLDLSRSRDHCCCMLLWGLCSPSPVARIHDQSQPVQYNTFRVLCLNQAVVQQLYGSKFSFFYESQLVD